MCGGCGVQLVVARQRRMWRETGQEWRGEEGGRGAEGREARRAFSPVTTCGGVDVGDWAAGQGANGSEGGDRQRDSTHPCTEAQAREWLV